MTDSLQSLRDHLARALDWKEAHLGFDKAIEGFPADRRGHRPRFTHSAWELLEHMRIAQNDLLDFCVNENYAHALKWPDDYWPGDSAPSEAEWNASIEAYKADRAALKKVASDPSIDLFAKVPMGKDTQTYLRSILLVIEHNAYHLGQLVAVRQSLT
jgi:uncharacterized damage-inducible protein DinB